MKAILFIIYAIFGLNIWLFSQAPESFNYQALIRDETGNVIKNKDVSIQIKIIDISNSDELNYYERHYVKTNNNGLVVLHIGEGNIQSGIFSEVDWGSGEYFLEIGIDLSGGNDFIILGRSKILSVPYALYARKAENAFSGEYSDLKNLPDFSEWDTLRADDFDGRYSSLTGAPTKLSDFENDIGFISVENDSSVTNEIQDLESVLLQGNSANNQIITELGSPLNPGDAVTKAYVDSLQARVSFLEEQLIFDNRYEFTDWRDGNTYKAVRIGRQIWMSENLAYMPMGGYWYKVYNCFDTTLEIAKSSSNYHNFGVLYSWGAALSACPAGWHLPTDSEWKELEMYIGMSKVQVDSTGARGNGEVKKLKSLFYWKPEERGNNSTGFSALPGGMYDYYYYQDPGTFGGLGYAGYWWTTELVTPLKSSFMYRVIVGNKIIREYTSLNSTSPSYLFSVRCIRDGDVKIQVPTVKTLEPGNISLRSAVIGADVTDDGGIDVQETGVYWSYDSIPEKTGKKLLLGIGAGEFKTVFGYLKPLTKYYIKAFAVNGAGESLGNLETFTTPVDPGNTIDSITDNRDGRIYRTVRIGNQWWTAGNVAYIPKADSFSINGAGYRIYHYYGIDPVEAKSTENYKEYGILYNYEAAKIVCPEGWHLPSDNEWKELEHFLGIDTSNIGFGAIGTDEGNKLKEIGNSHWIGTNFFATDETGFKALPGGTFYMYFNKLGYEGHFWTSTKPSTSVIERYLKADDPRIFRSHLSDSDSYGSVRCVKNE